jgi:hypothetical protein
VCERERVNEWYGRDKKVHFTLPLPHTQPQIHTHKHTHIHTYTYLLLFRSAASLARASMSAMSSRGTILHVTRVPWSAVRVTWHVWVCVGMCGCLCVCKFYTNTNMCRFTHIHTHTHIPGTDRSCTRLAPRGTNPPCVRSPRLL